MATEKVIFDACLSIPGVGLFSPGDEAEVSRELAEQLYAARNAHRWEPKRIAPARRSAVTKEDEDG